VAHGLDTLPGDCLVGQEPERPAGMACGWRTAPACDQPCLSRAIPAGRTGGRCLFLPVAGGVESLCDRTLSDAKHGIHTDGEALGYPLIRPGRTIRLGFQQEIGMAYRVGWGVPVPGQLGQWAAFLISKTDDVLFVQGTLRLRARDWLRRNHHLLTHKNKADNALGLTPIVAGFARKGKHHTAIASEFDSRLSPPYACSRSARFQNRSNPLVYGDHIPRAAGSHRPSGYDCRLSVYYEPGAHNI
jgi:hypothetical protein